MRRKLTMAAGSVTAAILLAAATGVMAAQASPDAVVPCDAAALASAISGAAAGATLSLTPGCSYLLTAALPQVSQDLTINGNRATLWRATNPGIPPFTILTLNGGNVTLNLVNFRNGNDAITMGNTATLTVNGGTFTGNSTTQNGGAISAGGAFSPVINGATFTDNSAAGSGGAIFDNVPSNGLGISGSFFTGNTAGQDGGAVWEYDEAGDMNGSKFSANSAGGDGGGIWVSDDAGEGFDGDSVRNNVAGGDGGGIYDAEGGNAGLVVSGSTISDNRAGGDGGGLWLPGATASANEVTGSTLRGNSAVNGGAIYDALVNWATLSGDDIVDNHASADGGGLYDDGPGDQGILSVSTTTFFANRAVGHGGGLFSGTAAVASGSAITANLGSGGGGGIYVDLSQGGSVALTSTPVTLNRPDNCQPAGSVPGCTH
jgi:predicted outer membrane repeat protein